MMKKFHFLFLLILGISFFNCGSKEVVGYLLVDYSTSCSDVKIRNAYFDDYKKIVKVLNDGSKLYLDKITSNSAATSSPLELSVPNFSIFKDNKLTFEEAHDSTITGFIKTSQEYFFNPNEEETDILNSLFNAQKTLSTDENKKKKRIIIIFSDMLQESEDFTLADIELTDNQINEIISGLKVNNKIPDLSDITVYIIGAGFTPPGLKAPSISKLNGLKKFWFQFFKETKAEIKNEYWGPRLVEFKY